MIKILLVDDQHILTEGLKMLLGAQADIDVIGQCENGELAVAFTKAVVPDVVLMDIQMPIMNGLEALKAIQALQLGVKGVMLTTFHDDAYISEALLNGAVGYLLKDSTPDAIADAIRSVYNGDALISPQVASKLVELYTKGNVHIENSPAIDLLTQRELEIVGLVGKGLNNKEISETLFISAGTVKNHLTKVLEKLDCRDRTQLAIFSLKNGLS